MINLANMQSSTYFLLRTVLRSTHCRCRLKNSQLRQTVQCLGSARLMSTGPLPMPDQGEKTYSPKITQIVDDISQLTLLEVADLNELLKKTLKIKDAPMMAMGVAPVAAPKAEEEEEAAQPQGKSTFTVKLTGFNADKKVALIKEIKNIIPGSNLVQAKKFVESTPVVVKADITKEEAEELIKTLEAVGAQTAMD